ncbi:MAG: ethylbenzene dehydrogenase-related protein [Acidimicrobiia bacterium]|nr:ethylbenzene dehydrogenase-related protein [Acidimicrobiia bacterium]
MTALTSTSPRTRRLIAIGLVLMLAIGFRIFDVTPAAAQSSILTSWSSTTDPGLDPNSAVWADTPATSVQLTAQNVTPPMSTGGIRAVNVRSVHYNNMLYVNLQWADTTPDMSTASVGTFADAVAMQFPSVAASSVPAICMGQADSAVNIWQWRADAQEGVSLMPDRGYVDLYQFTDDLYYPARAAGNIQSSTAAVQNLIAGGFGTLTPLNEQVIAGAGSHGALGWSVTLARPFTAPGENQPAFATGDMVDVAFAVWDGTNKDRNGQKSVSAFVRLEIAGNDFAAPPTVPASDAPFPWDTLALITIAVAVVGLVLAVFGRPSDWDGDDQPDQT